MNVLVFGATGPSGRDVVAAALAAGHKVTAFARNPDRGGFGPAVRTIAGDVRDAKAVAAALAGQEAVISTLGNNRQPKNPPCAEGIRNIVAAMKAAGLKRLVALSAYGTGDSRHGFYGWVLNTMLAEIQRDKVEMERALEASGLEWTAVRSPALTAKPGGATLAAATGIVLKGMPSITMADQGRWMVEELTARRFVGQKPILYRA